MIHAFMDEATTAGMVGQGRDPLDPAGNTISVTKFPSWFVEGMAQTASGPGNWLKHMGILANSLNTDINTAITKDKLGSGTTASEYGTGYLACMFLGAMIGNGGAVPTNSVSSETILVGLNRLLNKVIGGTSLDTAIKELTQNKFTSCNDFETKFGSNTSAYTSYFGGFTRNLLTQTGAGRGGLISGDLSAVDLAPDTPDHTVTLFKLDPTSGIVKNVYPSGHEIYSGGATDTDGIPPTGFTEGNLKKEYGDFVVTSAADGDIQYDSTTHTLTVKAGGDIKISMKTPVASTLQDKIIIDAAATGKITLSGINTTVSDTIEIKDGANVKLELDKKTILEV